MKTLIINSLVVLGWIAILVMVAALIGPCVSAPWGTIALIVFR